jgi:hypothetical protein
MKRSESVTTYPVGLVDKRAAAEWLGVSVSWLEKAAAAGEVPHTKVGGRNRWSADHLRQIVADGEVQVWHYEAPTRTKLTAVR